MPDDGRNPAGPAAERGDPDPDAVLARRRPASAVGPVPDDDRDPAGAATERGDPDPDGVLARRRAPSNR